MPSVSKLKAAQDKKYTERNTALSATSHGKSIIIGTGDRERGRGFREGDSAKRERTNKLHNKRGENKWMITQ